MLHPAYVAGLFDGEGCVALSFVKRRSWASDSTKTIYGFKFQLALSNTEQSIIEELKRQFEGTIAKGNAKKAKPWHKDVWSWHLQSSRTQRCFLEAIDPFVWIKRKQVDLAFAYLKTTVKPGQRLTQEVWEERLRIHNELRALNRRGPAAAPKYLPHDIVSKAQDTAHRYPRDELLTRMAKVRAAKSKRRDQPRLLASGLPGSR